MERSLVWSALAIGLTCWLVAFSRTRTKRFGLAGIDAALPPAFLYVAAGLPVLLFIVTLPSHGRIFAPGHDLGNGFLLGALGAILSGVPLIQNMMADAGERSHLRTAGPLGLGIACASVVLLLPHDTLYVALLSVAIGWLATTGILLLGMAQGRRAKDAVRPEPVTLIAGASFVTLLCATIALGDFHGEVTFIKTSTSLSWGVLALASAASIPLFLLLSAVADLIFNPEPDQRLKAKSSAAPALSETATLRAGVGRAVISVAGVAALGRMLSNRVVDSSVDDSPASPGRMAHLINVVIGPSRLFHVLSIGLLAGLLVWWINAAVQKREETDESSHSIHPWQNSALGVLVLLAGTMAAFQMLSGFGVGLMLLGMFPAVGLALLAANEANANRDADISRNEGAMRIVQLASMGAILALFRVYTTVNDALFPHSPYTDQYAAFGFVAGAVLPLFLAGYLFPKPVNSSDSTNTATTLVRLFVSGALILAIPSLLLVLWGQKCIMAFLIASAISAAGIGLTSKSDSLATDIRKLFPAIYAIGLSLALCEWSHYLLDMEDWTRIQKERVIVQIIGAGILLVLGSDYGPRAVAWFQARKDSSLASTPDSTRNGAAR